MKLITTIDVIEAPDHAAAASNALEIVHRYASYGCFSGEFNINIPQYPYVQDTGVTLWVPLVVKMSWKNDDNQ